MAAKPLLALGEFAQAEQDSLNEAAHASAAELHTVTSSADANEWLTGHDVRALLLSGTGNDPMQFALGTRAQQQHRKLPILALAKNPSDLEFAGAFSWGADDVVEPHRAWSITTRLRAMVRDLSASEPPPRGTAVIAEVDQNRRIATARVLFNAGYTVRFAVTREDAERFALEPQVSLVVICTELSPCPGELIQKSIDQGSAAAFVISAEPKRYLELCQEFANGADARVTDASAPPENVIFLANELAAGVLANKRAAVRVLHGTSVRFRPDGVEESEVGFTYNVSSGGLYVRTLAPPTEDIVWLELVPPSSTRRVFLVGEVVWRRPFGPHKKATVPPGFGCRIVDAPRSSLERWHEAVSAAGAKLTASS
jgi:hypothetical protein